MRTHGSLYDRIGILDTQIQENERQFEKLLDLYISGEFQKELLLERKSRLEVTIEKLRQKKDELSGHLQERSISDEQFSEITAFCDRIRGKLDNATFENKRKLFDL